MEEKSLLKRLKDWFDRKVNKTKALEEGKPEVVKKENRLDFCKTKLINELSNEEINLVLASEQDFNNPRLYDRKQLTEEILLRIGATPDLAKKTVENDRAYSVLGHHIGCGKLKSTVDGRVIFEDRYTYQDAHVCFPIEERTVIGYEDGKIRVENTEDYDYYQDCFDSKKVRNVSIFTNDKNGVTLENEEVSKSDKISTSTIAFDDNNIEVEKIMPIYEGNCERLITLIMRRCEQYPYIMRTSMIEDEEVGEEFIIEETVYLKYPDQLHSIVGGKNNAEVIPGKSRRTEIDWNELRSRNPKAAKFFYEEEHGKEDEVNQEV